jgi:hypothetical protein
MKPPCSRKAKLILRARRYGRIQPELDRRHDGVQGGTFGRSRGCDHRHRRGCRKRALVPASIGAVAACVLIFIIGVLIRRPLAKVPENTLKFVVGVMLSAFGVFWTGEGLGVPWPGHHFILFAFAVVFLLTGIATASMLRRPTTGRAQ